MSLIRNIPNIVTLLNLFFGCIAVISTLYEFYMIVFWCFIISIAMDFADGMLARLLNAQSPIGKELDSLADMVSFGVLPGMIFFVLLGGNESNISNLGDWRPFLGILFTLLACLRLAKFNIDTRQSVDFIGLNTPTATSFVIGLLMIYEKDVFGLKDFVSQQIVLLPIIFALSYLMVSKIPMFSGKFKGLKWKGNEIKIIFVLLAIIELFIFGYAAFSVIVLTYILLSVLVQITKK